MVSSKKKGGGGLAAIFLSRVRKSIHFVQTWKAKQGFGYVESDEITEVTPIRENCSQTQWKELSIESEIAVHVDVFNRRIVGSFRR